MSDNALVKIGNATRMLAEARSLGDFKKISDLARAAKEYAQAAKLGQEAVDYATEIRFRAEKGMGELLRASPKATGGDAQRTRFHKGTESTPTLSDVGLTKKESSRFQMLDSLPKEQFEAVATGEKKLTEVRREVRREKMSTPKAPSGKFRVFYADPPWSYGNSGAIGDTDNYGHAERHYPSMSIQQLCDLPIKELVEDDAVLFLWVTSPLLDECWPVIKAWGFEYKTSMVWDKDAHNFGHYVSVRHELLLICTRGSCTPDIKELPPSVMKIKRSNVHSQKPDEFRKLIEKMYPNGNKIELFAREKSEGWKFYGNEL